jgi:hypothetical protein
MWKMREKKEKKEKFCNMKLDRVNTKRSKVITQLESQLSKEKKSIAKENRKIILNFDMEHHANHNLSAFRVFLTLNINFQTFIILLNVLILLLLVNTQQKIKYKKTQKFFILHFHIFCSIDTQVFLHLHNVLIIQSHDEQPFFLIYKQQQKI